MNDNFNPSDAIPKLVRTWAYALGLVFGLGVAPALLALDLVAWSGVAIAVSGAANAIAFGYRPTREE